MNGKKSERDLNLLAATYRQFKVDGHLPCALPLVFETQHQHGKAVEGEAPDHTEGVRFAEGDDVAAAEDDGDQLQANDHINDAEAGAVFLLWFAKPIRQHTIFGNT